MLRLYLTGHLAIEAPAGILDEQALPGRQGRLALAYLALDAQRPVARDSLADAIWADEVPPSWDVALTALVSRLRTVLVRAGFDPARAITAVSGCYQLHLPDPCWMDLEACPVAVDAAESALRRGDGAMAWSEATVASAIARRPFLAGEDRPWIDEVRAKLRGWRVRALDCLTEVWLDRGHAALAISLASESVGLEPYHEHAYRNLMRAHFLAGDRAEAIRTYERCATLLDGELGVQPHPETVRLRDFLLRGT